MIDEERRKLIRDVELGDETAIPRLQQMNDRMGLSADAEYLQKYLNLCERCLSGETYFDAADEELLALNKEYQTQVGSKTLKESTMGTKRSYYDDGWSSSQLCA